MERNVYEINNTDLSEYRIKLNEALFHNANGYVGFRYDFEEGYPEDYDITYCQYINGFYDFMEAKQAENLYGLINEKQITVNIANTQIIKLYLADESFSMYEGTVLESHLSLDMNKGVTVRKVLWRSPKGKEIRITITRMASFFQQTLFVIDYEVEALNFSGDIHFESVHNGNTINYADPKDPRNADEARKFINAISCEIIGGISYIAGKTTKSELFISSAVGHKIENVGEIDFFIEDKKIKCTLKTNTDNNLVKMVKYAVFTDSIRYQNHKEESLRQIEKAMAIPLKELYIKQEEYLNDYWEKCAVRIDGDHELDLAMRFNLFHLVQSISKDEFGNIAPKGLSGDGYEGNYFWDSEMYTQAFFTITNPNLTKPLIVYRYRTLDMARENAKKMGHSKGALFPWRTIMGRESSAYFPAGSAQYHINGAVAYAIIAYYLATKDLKFILEYGAEIVFETARLWMDVGNYHDDVFNINTVTGPDEYTCIVNNNYYTNALAKYHLSWAEKFYNILKSSPGFIDLTRKIVLKETEIEEFKAAAEKMYLPYDEKLKLNPQDDSFLQKQVWDIDSIPQEKIPLLLNYHPLYIYRRQICKQADTVFAHFILEDLQSEETMKNSYLYYEKITTHDSSLSKPIFSIMASRLGMEEKALRYFGDSAKNDLLNQQKNTDDGIHAACMAGSYMVIVYGFAGFRLKEDGIHFSPSLPKVWNGYQFKISYESSRLMVDIQEKYCRFVLESGEPKKIHVYEKEYTLTSAIKVSREIRSIDPMGKTKDPGQGKILSPALEAERVGIGMRVLRTFGFKKNKKQV